MGHGQQVQGAAAGRPAASNAWRRPGRRCPGRATKYVYFPGTGEVEAANAVDMRNRSFSITAEVEIPKGGAEGVLLAQGGQIRRAHVLRQQGPEAAVLPQLPRP